jgi:hypothetical protein
LQHTKYELVEDEDMHSHPINFGTWFHCNFKAKDSSIEEFFAEIYAKISGLESVVTTCQVLKGKTQPHVPDKYSEKLCPSIHHI